jgi:hypothetical protein
MLLFYASFYSILIGALLASFVMKTLHKNSFNLVFGHKLYFAIIVFSSISLYLIFLFSDFKECGFNLVEIYECRDSFTAEQKNITDIMLIFSSTLLPFAYLLSKKSHLLWLSFVNALAFLCAYIILFIYTGHKSIFALSIFILFVKYATDKSKSLRSSTQEINAVHFLPKASSFSFLLVICVYIIFSLLYFPIFNEVRWIWALFVNRLMLVPGYLDFVYVTEHIQGSLPDFASAAQETGKIITGKYETWSNASFFGSSFLRGGIPRLVAESVALGFLLYTFCTQKRTALMEGLSIVGLLQCFIVLLSLDLQNALLDRGLFFLWFLVFFSGSNAQTSTELP